MKNAIILLLITISLMGCKDDITTIPWTAETHEISRLLNVGKPGSYWVYEDSVNQILDECDEFEYSESYCKSQKYNFKKYCRPNYFFLSVNGTFVGHISGGNFSNFTFETKQTPYNKFENVYHIEYDDYNYYFVKDTGLIEFNLKMSGNILNYKLKDIKL